MSCRYAFLGLPRGKGYTKAERIKCAEDAILLNCVQTELEKRIGCFFYNFTPEFFVDKVDSDKNPTHKFLKVGISNCPGYSYGIVKVTLKEDEDVLDQYVPNFDVAIQVTLYRGCCVARYFTFKITDCDDCCCSSDST
jgi:hypothetical protein